MGIRFFGEANDINGVTWKVEIHDVSYSSTSTEVKLGGGIFTHEFDGYDKLYFTPTQPSRCMVPIIVRPTDNTFETFIDDLVLAKENQYFIIIKRNNSKYFIGNLLVDQVQYDDNETFVIELTATDGLKRLEKYDFDEILTASGSHYTDIAAIIDALSYTGFEQFYTNSEPYVDSVVNWFEVNQDKVNGPLLETRTQVELFYEDVEKKKPKKCSDVIKLILEKYGASLKFANGRWVISQFENHAAASANVYQYAKNKTLLGQTLIGSDVTLTGGNSTRDRLINTYLPALNRVEIKQKGESEWIYARENVALSGSVITTRNVKDMSGEELIISFRWILDSAMATNMFYKTKSVLTFNINEGNYYLKYDRATGETSWTTNSSDRYFYDTAINNALRVTIAEGEFRTPPLPAGASGSPISVTITAQTVQQRVPTSTGPLFNNYNADFGAGFVRIAQFMGAVGTGVGTFVEQTTTAAITTLLENSEVIEEEVEIYEQENNVEFVKQWPQIYVGAGVWENSEAWSQNILSTSGVLLAELLSKEAIYHQRTPRKLIQGAFRLNTFYPYDTLIWRGKRWVFKSGSFNAKMCEWEGEWIEYLRQTTSTTVSVKKPIRDVEAILLDDTSYMQSHLGSTDEAIKNIYQQISFIQQSMSSAIVNYIFDDSTTMASPSDGRIRLNNATLASVTKMAISEYTYQDVNNIESYLNLQNNDIIYIKDVYNSDNWAVYKTGNITDNTTWAEINLTYEDSGGTFADNTVCSITITRKHNL
jgi:hypothetical protein